MPKYYKRVLWGLQTKVIILFGKQSILKPNVHTDPVDSIFLSSSAQLWKKKP